MKLNYNIKMKTNVILQGNCIEKLKELPDESIDCVMTSPPYWALRDYGSDVETIWGGDFGWEDCEHKWNSKDRKIHSGKTKSTPQASVDKVGGFMTDWTTTDHFCNLCGAWKGQLGLEPTFDLYIKHLCNIFDEIKRVLKKTGTCFINLGDTYGGTQGRGEGKGNENNQMIPMKMKTMDKCLVMIPFRFAIEMVNRGWILRNNIIWHKPNCMPSSVKDRFTVDFEYVFFFTKNKKYFFETQYEPLSDVTINDINKRKNMDCITGKRGSKEFKQDKPIYQVPKKGRLRTDFINSKGRNKRTVWKISPKPFKEAHFAVYPEELCETPIKAGCPEFVCVKCGKPKELQVELKKVNIVKCNARGELRPNTGEDIHMTKSMGYKEKYNTEKTFKGYKPTCNCKVEFTGGITLDPFFGAGTTGLVSLKQNKKFIGIELNPEYIEIANKRLKPYLEQRKL